MDETNEFDATVAEAIKVLWKDPGTKNILKYLRKYFYNLTFFLFIFYYLFVYLSSWICELFCFTDSRPFYSLFIFFLVLYLFLFLFLFPFLGVQAVWSRRNEFQITESVQYYFEKIDIIKMKNYLPDKVCFPFPSLLFFFFSF